MMNCWEAIKFTGFIYDHQNKMYFSQKESYSSIFQKHHSQVKKARYLTTTKNLSGSKTPTLSNMPHFFVSASVLKRDFSGGTDSKESACNAGDLGSIPGSGRFPGEGNGNPLQYSCLGNHMDRGAWWAVTVHGVTKSWT